MYPATQTTHAPTSPDHAPSLADIVHEQTQGGRLIVDFLAQAMLGDLPDFKPHHRLQASDRLIKLDASPEFTGMVREHTQRGNLISQFLIRAVTGQLPDFKPCHRMEATRQLAIINPKMARALAEDNTPRRSRDHDRRSREGAPRTHAGAVLDRQWIAPQPCSSPGISRIGHGVYATATDRDMLQRVRHRRHGGHTSTCCLTSNLRFWAAEVLINWGYASDVAAPLPRSGEYHVTQDAADDRVRLCTLPIEREYERCPRRWAGRRRGSRSGSTSSIPKTTPTTSTATAKRTTDATATATKLTVILYLGGAQNYWIHVRTPSPLPDALSVTSPITSVQHLCPRLPACPP